MTSRRDDEYYPRKQTNAPPAYTANDVMELRKTYRFVPNDDDNGEEDNDNNIGDPPKKNNHKQKLRSAINTSRTSTTTWQERMARTYEQQLYREYVLADLTRVHLHRSGPVGLRWRTKAEVLQGKGELSCGNKHCPSYNKKHVPPPNLNRPPPTAGGNNVKDEQMATQNEEDRLRSSYEYGQELHSYEVLFAYQDDGDDVQRRKKKKKNELAKLRLCIRCAPLLFYHKGWVLGAKRAREAEAAAASAGEMMKQQSIGGDHDDDNDGKRKASACINSDDDDNDDVKSVSALALAGRGDGHVKRSKKRKRDGTRTRRKDLLG
mmetsp:Transcript_1374/g.2220  ORF Transcript_1374/g.2220 Transcript_1374/m.2220 type:complete len:320 (+) Transcript_1374:610-1569(+)|eukprot:CAMPEP_0196809750 /NCGR_PEP_ID=MMETSP1362-20130617/9631_1 /TAXON_ID=163516 /ORGANISM="Leptocylindrus danicus, Strain CCMP1856" /LENGTH=319 /DNA_ID=CAMNT_0042184519 /DNA_START=612 /DNA_END=1571 /DNA_ORIENTATION=+